MDRGTAQQTDVNDAQVSAPRSDAPQSGLQFSRVFSRESVDPFDEIAWEQRSATIGNEHGELVFEQRDVGDDLCGVEIFSGTARNSRS